MAGIKDLANFWRNIKEIELRPIKEEAERAIKIAIVGAQGSGRHTLAEQMRRDAHRPDVSVQTPLLILELTDAEEQAAQADLIILLVDITQGQTNRQRFLAQYWINTGKKVFVFINKLDVLPPDRASLQMHSWAAANVLSGSVQDYGFLVKSLVPMVLNMLPGRHLALGRQFPLFRVTVANQLIGEASLSNAAYAFSTGMAEMMPNLDLPLNIADMIILTKAQAFLVYRLGLVLGFSTRWQDYITEFSSVIGSGFVWRQIARQLVGLIPGWGLVPKIAVSYAGTYVVGHVVLRWYLTGRHLDRKQINALYKQALVSGKQHARDLIKRLPKPRLRRPKKDKAVLLAQSSPALPDQAGTLPAQSQDCLYCGRASAVDARFCQYCGKEFEPLAPGVVADDSDSQAGSPAGEFSPDL